jgi:hypothetical protein
MSHIAMKLYSSKAALKRAMEAIVPGAFQQAVDDGRVRQGPTGKWFEEQPHPMARPDHRFLDVQKGDTSLVRVREKFLAYGGQWEQSAR